MSFSATKVGALALLFLVANVTRADEVDTYLEAQIAKLHIPGASLAVVRDGKIIKTQGYGLANLELKTPATKSTAYEIGSLTKQFTAAAIMLLVEEGKLRLDDSVTKYFSEAPEAWRAITLQHLLTHTSGIQNHVAVPGYLKAFKMNLDGDETPTRDELLKMFFALPLEFQPGETWAYDNTGYILLGFIIEKVTGKTYWQFMDERLFQPLKMNATRSTDTRPIIPNRASGYAWVKDHFDNRPVLAPFIAFSAGSILSTVEDMAKWDAALSSEKLIKRSSIERMWSATKTNDGATCPYDYGFGWFIAAYKDHRIIQHSGGTPGFSSSMYRFLDDKLTVILLTNRSDKILDQLAIDIAGLYAPALKRPERQNDPDPELSARLQGIISGLLHAKFDPETFTPAMQKFLKTATGKEFLEWYREHGEVTSFTFAGEEKGDSNRLRRYRVGLGGNLYWFSIDLEGDEKIAQIYSW